MNIALAHPSTGRGRRRCLVAVALLAPLIALAACSTGRVAGPEESAAPSSSLVESVPGWPSAMAAIGHSGLTGYDSDEPRVDALGNSWATGENPDVDSVYLRVVAENPAMKDHAVNLAVDGSGVVDLLRQATEITTLSPKPELVIVQSIDNDMQCDGTDAEHLPVYRAGLIEVMDTLSEGLPDATVLFVSQWGSVAIYDAAVVQVDPSHLAGTGPCATLDAATKQVIPEKEAAMQAIVDEYFTTIVEVCSAYVNCVTDVGAMQSLALAPGDLSEDLNHLTVSGHAKMAAIAWEVLYPGGQ